jgi:hypothetical protein
MSGDTTQFRFHCPACGSALNTPVNTVGQRTTCPQCKVSITIPEALSPRAAATSDDHPQSIALPTLARAEAPAWREIVRTNREFVPLIECAAGIGSGLLVSVDGFVVTNRHVVEMAQLFMVHFYDGSKAKAVVVHTHPHRDLAILRAGIRRDKCFDIENQVTDEVQAGDDVLAIGNPRGFAFTSTRGIVSETRRRLADGEYIQTDVAINPGNSGGPLLDQFGRLVGLNTRVQSEAQGLGFALRAAEVQAYVLYVQDLIRRRELPCPTDEQIAAAEAKLMPWDIANAAARASGLHHRREGLTNGEQVLSVQSAGGHTFMIAIGGNIFRVSGRIADNMSEHRMRDAELLRRLLGWQAELCGPSFEIAGHNLYVTFKRSVEGLDVNEAREAILRVADAIDALEPPIRKYLS